MSFLDTRTHDLSNLFDFSHVGIPTFKCMTGCAPVYLSEQFVKCGDISPQTMRS